MALGRPGECRGGGAEPLRCRVVAGGDPAVAEAGDAPQAGGRAPAGDPQRRALRADGPWLELAAGAEQPAELCDGGVEALPALGEGEADGVVVARRGAGPEAGDEPAFGEDVEGGEGLGGLRRAADDGQADGGGDRHVGRGVDGRGQGDRTVEPRPTEEQVVVGAEVGVAQARRLLRERAQLGERPALAVEGDQREVGSVLHRHIELQRSPRGRVLCGGVVGSWS